MVSFTTLIALAAASSGVLGAPAPRITAAPQNDRRQYEQYGTYAGWRLDDQGWHRVDENQPRHFRSKNWQEAQSIASVVSASKDSHISLASMSMQSVASVASVQLASITQAAASALSTQSIASIASVASVASVSRASVASAMATPAKVCHWECNGSDYWKSSKNHGPSGGWNGQNLLCDFVSSGDIIELVYYTCEYSWSGGQLLMTHSAGTAGLCPQDARQECS